MKERTEKRLALKKTLRALQRVMEDNAISQETVCEALKEAGLSDDADGFANAIKTGNLTFHQVLIALDLAGVTARQFFAEIYGLQPPYWYETVRLVATMEPSLLPALLRTLVDDIAALPTPTDAELSRLSVYSFVGQNAKRLLEEAAEAAECDEQTE